MRLRGELNLLLELADGLAPGFLKGGVDPSVELFKKRFRAAMQLVAVQAKDIIELRLKAGKGVLLCGFDALGKMLEMSERFVGSLECRFDALPLRLRGIARV